jgi:hypothetical protein
MKEIYKKYVAFLTIQKDLDISISPEYQAIRRENDILRSEVERQIVTREDFKALAEILISSPFVHIPEEVKKKIIEVAPVPSDEVKKRIKDLKF